MHLTQIFLQNGGIFKAGKYSVELPANTVAEGSTFEMKAAPTAKTSDNWNLSDL